MYEVVRHCWEDYGLYIAATGVVLAGGAVAANQLLAPPAPKYRPPRVQSVMLPAEKRGESPVYRSSISPDKLVTHVFDDVRTLYDGFQRGLRINPKGNCLGWREGNGPFKWLSYEEVAERTLNVGSGLLSIGLKPKDFVGIFAPNRVEWTLTEQACNAFSMAVVPLYDTLGDEAVEFILDESEVSVVVVSENKLKGLLKNITRHKHLKTLVVMGELNNSKEVKQSFSQHGVRVMRFRKLEQLGKEAKQDPVPPSADDLSTICYTSGTTGRPKGAMLTHGNIVSNVAGVLTLKPDIFTKDDVCISYLPLAHVFERLVQAGLFVTGGCTGFFRGTVQELFDDIALLQPTIFPSVPRLYNRLYDKVMAQRAMMKGVKKTLFEHAWAKKQALLKQGIVRSPLWDALVFSKVSAKLGGRVRTMITGAAPLSPQVKDFLRICFSCDLFEGYGQTECCGVATATLPGDLSNGHVGSPVPCGEIKLVDVPDMEYLATDKPFPRGEVCYRGAHVFRGYFKSEEKTREALDEDGWLHSGDIGTVRDDGTLKIIDRKKNIFKLAQGEYIAPDKLEDAYSKSPLVLQIFVHGESIKASLVAIVVPDPETLLPWAKEKGLSGDLAELCRSDVVKKAILASLKEAAEAASLKGFERIADIYVDATPFSVENDLLTPTFKLKRPQAAKYYEEQIQAMYEHLE